MLSPQPGGPEASCFLAPQLGAKVAAGLARPVAEHRVTADHHSMAGFQNGLSPHPHPLSCFRGDCSFEGR